MKPGSGSVEDYIEQRFRRNRGRQISPQGRRIPRFMIFIINGILIAFMIFLIRSKEAGQEYHTATLQAGGITYRLSLGRAKGAPYRATLTLTAGRDNPRPVPVPEPLAILSIHHGESKILEQAIADPSGRTVISPGVETTVPVTLHTGALDSYFAAHPDRLPEPVRVPFVPTVVTVPLTARLTVQTPEEKELSLTFKYEVKQ
ncbi:MAG: hypothetical protein JXA20_18350 [Spirochaetes bacterium]|nr:hypothetical protein [Spirochaetota bacterium]